MKILNTLMSIFMWSLGVILLIEKDLTTASIWFVGVVIMNRLDEKL